MQGSAGSVTPHEYRSVFKSDAMHWFVRCMSDPRVQSSRLIVTGRQQTGDKTVICCLPTSNRDELLCDCNTLLNGANPRSGSYTWLRSPKASRNPAGTLNPLSRQTKSRNIHCRRAQTWSQEEKVHGIIGKRHGLEDSKCVPP